jgi:putative transposase
VINAVVLVATGVNGDWHREVLGMRVATSETGAAWSSFFADLVARGVGGVLLVTSDAHAGLIESIAGHLPGASWQRSRTHYATILRPICPESMWPAVKAMLHSVCDQPDAAAVTGQFDRLLDYVAEQTDEWAEGRRYPGLEVLVRCRLTLTTNPVNEVTTEALPALTA